jgi:hypothetical protein
MNYTELADLLERAASALREADAALSRVDLPAAAGGGGATPLAGLGVSERVLRNLGCSPEWNGGMQRIDTVEQLCRQSAEDLLCRRNFGQTSLEEVRRGLRARGLCLRGER